MKKYLYFLLCCIIIFLISIRVDFYGNLFIHGNSVFYLIYFVFLLVIYSNDFFKILKSKKNILISLPFIISISYFFRDYISRIPIYLTILLLLTVYFNIGIILLFINNIKKGKVELQKRLNWRIITYSMILSFLLTVFHLLGSNIINKKTVIDLLNIATVGKGLFIFIILTIIIITFYVKLYRINKLDNKLPKKSKKIFMIIFLTFISIYLVYYLMYFPGIFSQDSFYSIGQALGYFELNNHHPVTFTLLLKLFLMIFRSVKTAMIVYCLFQICMLSLAFSVLIYYLINNNIKLIYILICYLFLLLSPINAMYSFTVWKDIPFTIFVIYFVILLVDILNKNMTKLNIRYLLLFILGVCVSVSRNNGIYLIFLLIPFIILILKKQSVVITIILVLSLFCAFVIKGPIFKMLNVEDGSIKEALSIPIQQIARFSKYYPNEISKKQYNVIDKFLDAKNIGNLYDPIISDPVKSTWKNIDFSNNYKEFLSVWFDLFKKHPNIYFDSFFENSYGYWYPETVYWSVYEKNATEATWLYFEEYDLDNQPIIKHSFTTENVIIQLRKLPVISMLFSAGFCFWILLFSIFNLLINRKYKLLIVYIMMLLLWLTVIASPVFCEFRYIYPLYTLMPFLLCYSLFFDNFKIQK